MSDNQDQFSPPPPPSEPPGFSAAMPAPPPPPPMAMPVMLPAPPKRGLASRIKDAIVLMIFFGSLVLNLILLAGLAAIGSQQIEGHIRESVLREGASDQRIAVINIKGIINDELAAELWPQFNKVIKSADYKAVVLNVNSPGGGVGASDTIAHYVAQVKESGKNVVAFMGSVAASGGYYVSARADYIMAGPTTITGSIGVIATLPNFHGTLAKIGAEMIVIPSTPATRKSAGSPFIPWDPANRKYFQKLIDSAHDRFVDVVFEGRQTHFPNKGISAVKKLADGAALTSVQAKDAKLIDQDDAYFQQAVDKAADLAQLSDPHVVRLGRPPNLREMLSSAQQSKTSLINLDASLVDEVTTPRLLYLWQGQ